MKIKQLYYKDNNSKLEIDIEDISNFTLLVGISGVGKTQILKSIRALKNIISGKTLGYDGVLWKAVFEIKGEEYSWSGEFSKDKNISRFSKYIQDGELYSLPKIKWEKLEINSDLIIDRSKSNLEFKGNLTPKISLNKSFISIFSEEEKIDTLYEALNKIFWLNYEEEKKYVLRSQSIADLTNIRKYDSLNDVIKLHNPLIHKVAIVYNCFPDKFKEIKKYFKDIFPHVTDLKFTTDFDKEVYLLAVKERDTLWVPQYEFSSGMYKTLMVIAELMLLEEGSTILFDELENSLGVNCIDDVVDIMLSTDRDVQFIATSHHPYIINTISLSNWRIVIREGSKISVTNTNDIGLGNSKHDAFKQLINSSVYRGY